MSHSTEAEAIFQCKFPEEEDLCLYLTGSFPPEGLPWTISTSVASLSHLQVASETCEMDLSERILQKQIHSLGFHRR